MRPARLRHPRPVVGARRPAAGARRLVVGVVVASALVVSAPLRTVGASAAAPAFTDGFASLLGAPAWSEGTIHGEWTDQFNGFGTSHVVSDIEVSLAEQPVPPSPGTTHAVLVTSRPAFADVDLRLRVRTVRQLRGAAANPWEVGWVLWHLGDKAHFYALVLKPNGWELDKEDPAYPGGQRFLASGSTPRFAVGSWHDVRVVQIGATIAAWADGAPLAYLSDAQRPYLRGLLGLYTEDAEAHFSSVTVAAP